MKVRSSTSGYTTEATLQSLAEEVGEEFVIHHEW